MEGEASLSDYLRVLYKGKKLIFGLVFGITSLAIFISFFVTSTYKTEASILPMGGGGASGLNVAIRQMGLAGIMGGLGEGGELGEQLMVILSSRTMAEKLIERFNLIEVFYGKRARDPKRLVPMEKVIEQFRRHVFAEMRRINKVIVITAVMNDSKLAADVVNGCIEELEDYLKNSYFTAAKKRRIFVENQLERNRMNLLDAGRELSAAYDPRNVSNVNSTVDVDVSVGDSSDKEDSVLAEKDKDQPLYSNESPVSPGTDISAGFPGVSSAFATVQEKAGELQARTDELLEKIKKTKVVKNVPQQVYLQYLILHKALLREVNQLLARQYELAKIEEAKEELSFQIIDKARVPVSRYQPNRKFIAISTFTASLLGSVFLAFLLEYLRERRSKKQVC